MNPNLVMMQRAHLSLGHGLLAGAVLLSFQATAAITGVEQSGGDTDRPTAKYTGQTFDISNPTGTVLSAAYTVGTFADGAKTFVDRLHAWSPASATVPIPSYLVGGQYVLNANNNRDNASFSLSISVSVPSFIYLLVDNRRGDSIGGILVPDNSNPPTIGPGTGNMEWVSEANGWSPLATGLNRAGDFNRPDEVGVDENANGTIDNWSSVYVKQVDAGTVTLGEYNQAGQNMWGAVVQPVAPAVPEPGTWALLLTGLGVGCWAVRRRA